MSDCRTGWAVYDNDQGHWSSHLRGETDCLTESWRVNRPPSPLICLTPITRGQYDVNVAWNAIIKPPHQRTNTSSAAAASSLIDVSLLPQRVCRRHWYCSLKIFIHHVWYRNNKEKRTYRKQTKYKNVSETTLNHDDKLPKCYRGETSLSSSTSFCGFSQQSSSSSLIITRLEAHD